MQTLRNDTIELSIGEDGAGLRIEDRRRGGPWVLQPGTAAVRRAAGGGAAERRISGGGVMAAEGVELAGGRARVEGDTLRVVYAMPEGEVRFRWTLADDCVEVTLEAAPDAFEFVALPGAFAPADGGAFEVASPQYQGVLIRGGGGDWQMSGQGGGHRGFSMAMHGVLGARGGLLVTQESATDWVGTVGVAGGVPRFVFEQWRCPIDGWYPRTVRIWPVDGDLVSICTRYRDRVIVRGEFVGWDEKIERKPIVQKLFGALMAFLGYDRSDGTDYVASAAQLKAMGFETILFYPVRLCHWSLDFQMGGDEPIWLSDETIARMKALGGVLLSPWAWVHDCIDDGAPATRARFLRDAAGNPVQHWQIDETRWYQVCTPYQVEHMRRRFATDMAAVDWVHYDVNAMRPGRCCFSAEHAAHGNRPMGRREDLAWVRRLLGPETNGNRIVSSEGFVDRYTCAYDIGSTKLFPAFGDARCVPVPMTMLVFHDSTVHDWWEVHNYNEHPGFAGLSDQVVGANACGRPEQKAAMDALYGCPPNVFPFGRQYGWANIETRESFSYQVRLADEPVQRALRAALPVARLHRRIGRCRMTDFRFLSDDRAVQSTTFSDGTRVAANLSDEPREAAEFGLLSPRSWRAVPGGGESGY